MATTPNGWETAAKKCARQTNQPTRLGGQTHNRCASLFGSAAMSPGALDGRKTLECSREALIEEADDEDEADGCTLLFHRQPPLCLRG